MFPALIVLLDFFYSMNHHEILLYRYSEVGTSDRIAIFKFYDSFGTQKKQSLSIGLAKLSDFKYQTSKTGVSAVSGISAVLGVAVVACVIAVACEPANECVPDVPGSLLLLTSVLLSAFLLVLSSLLLLAFLLLLLFLLLMALCCCWLPCQSWHPYIIVAGVEALV